MSVKVTVETFSDAIKLIIAEYGEAVTEETRELIKEAGNKALEKVKELSPGDKGNYRDSWTATFNRKDASTALTGKDAGFARVYNKKHYRLTHLLEHGHAMRQGGRAREFPHIGKAQEYASDWLDGELQRRLQEVT